jgi:hypothetical protein
VHRHVKFEAAVTRRIIECENARNRALLERHFNAPDIDFIAARKPSTTKR